MKNHSIHTIRIAALVSAAALCITFPAAVLAGVSGTGNIAAISTAACQFNQQQLESLVQESTGYAKSYALYRIAQLGYTSAELDELNEWLSTAAQTISGKSDPESKALLAGIYALTMGRNPSQAMALYPQAEKLLAQAGADQSSAGRALFLQGISTFHLPPDYGGGAENAIAQFKASIDAFEKQRAEGALDPIGWGEAEAHLWLARAYQKTGAEPSATEHFRIAKKMEPECKWTLSYEEVGKDS